MAHGPSPVGEACACHLAKPQVTVAGGCSVPEFVLHRTESIACRSGMAPEGRLVHLLIQSSSGQGSEMAENSLP